VFEFEVVRKQGTVLKKALVMLLGLPGAREIVPPFVTREQRERRSKFWKGAALACQTGPVLRPDSGRHWRRVLAHGGII